MGKLGSNIRMPTVLLELNVRLGACHGHRGCVLHPVQRDATPNLSPPTHGRLSPLPHGCWASHYAIKLLHYAHTLLHAVMLQSLQMRRRAYLVWTLKCIVWASCFPGQQAPVALPAQARRQCISSR